MEKLYTQNIGLRKNTYRAQPKGNSVRQSMAQVLVGGISTRIERDSELFSNYFAVFLSRKRTGPEIFHLICLSGKIPLAGMIEKLQAGFDVRYLRLCDQTSRIF